MTDITEIQSEIKAVKFALGTFADYEHQEERRNFLRQNFSTVPGLKTYFGFSEDKLQEALNKLQHEKNLLLAQQGKHLSLCFLTVSLSCCIVDSAVDCTDLKKALLSAKEVDGFLCLSGSEVFPVSLKETTNRIPSKLLIRSFHKEIKLILQKLIDATMVKKGQEVQPGRFEEADQPCCAVPPA